MDEFLSGSKHNFMIGIFKTDGAAIRESEDASALELRREASVGHCDKRWSTDGNRICPGLLLFWFFGCSFHMVGRDRLSRSIL